jgi:hypothetical protein
MITGIAAITIHAPWVNFVTVTITSTTPVAVAPIAFNVMLRRHPGSRSLHQRRTMPDWESVKAVKTPTTYSWIRLVSSASNA